MSSLTIRLACLFDPHLMSLGFGLLVGQWTEEWEIAWLNIAMDERLSAPTTSCLMRNGYACTVRVSVWDGVELT